jgi:ribosomal protein S18 acetylase RimI-like enzyme
MTNTLAPQRTTVGVRPYRPTDHSACRRLWAEFIEQQRAFHNDPTLGGSDPGAGFEEYLTRLDLSGMWVADDGGVVGFVGLVLDGRAGAVDPIVVTSQRRGQGIGRSLLVHVTEQARRRGLRELTISPALRNMEAIACLHAVGYDVLTNVTMSLSLNRRPGSLHEGLELHGRRFRY